MLSFDKVWLVAWREYLENVRTKAFIFGVILTPVLMGAIFVVPLLFPDEDRRIVIVDGTGEMKPVLVAALEQSNQGKDRGRTVVLEDPDSLIPLADADAGGRLQAAEKRLIEWVKSGHRPGEKETLFGALILGPELLTDDAAVRDGTAVRFHTQRPTDRTVPNLVRGLITGLRRPLRMSRFLQSYLESAGFAFAGFPLTIERVATEQAGAGEAPYRLHVCDGVGTLLPAIQPLLGGKDAAAAGRDLERLGLGGASSVGSLLEKSLGWTLDPWVAPRIEGAERPEEVMLLALGMEGLPSALFQRKDGDAPAAVPLADAAAQFRARLERGELDGYLVVHRDLTSRASGPATGDAVLYVREGIPEASVTQLAALWKYLLWTTRFQFDALHANVTPSISILDPERGGERYGQEDVMAKLLVPLAFVMLLFYGVFGIAQALLNSVIEEKSNRIVEVLLSSITPLELMFGKIVGVGLVGFTLVALWATGSYVTASHQLGSEFMAVHLRPELLVWFLVYYVLGFLLLASVIAGVGATCNTIKEAQNYMGAISILYVIPMLTIMPISQQPEGTMAKVLSFIPPLTPFVMMNRLAATKTIGLGELLAGVALLVVSIALAIWLAARVFRVGILMYGKPPQLAEIWRWIRRG